MRGAGPGAVGRAATKIVAVRRRVGVGGVLAPLPGGAVGRDAVERGRRAQGADAEVLGHVHGPLTEVCRTTVAAVVRVPLARPEREDRGSDTRGHNPFWPAPHCRL